MVVVDGYGTTEAGTLAHNGAVPSGNFSNNEMKRSNY